MERRTFYQVMMLDPTATPEVVNAVYRVLAKQYHPDHAGPDAAGRMAELNEAYAVLGKEEQRARYDKKLKIATVPGREARTTNGKAAAGAASGDTILDEPAPTASSFSRDSAPGATNLKFEAGQWSVRPPSEPTPPPPEFGEAGAPPAYLPRIGTTIAFGRYRGWTVNQVAAFDRNYVEWLSRTMAGRTYRAELRQALAQPA